MACIRTILLTGLVGLALAIVLAPLNSAADDKKNPEPDVIYVPTPTTVVDKMLEMAKVTKDDILYDLGCGDARIPVTAAKKFGCKTKGFDIDPDRMKDSLETIKKHMSGELATYQTKNPSGSDWTIQRITLNTDLVTIEKKNIFDLDLSKASVVTLYLLPELNVRLIPQLKKLKDGSRIVSHDFDMKGAKPKQVIRMMAKDDEGREAEHLVYLWTVPWEKED